MENKDIVYLVSNEFQLLITLHQFYKFQESRTGSFNVIISVQEKSRRLSLNQYKLPFNYILVKNILNNIPLTESIDYSKILNENFKKVDELYVFHDALLFNTHIIRIFKKMFSSKVYLIQEGIGGYYKHKPNMSLYVRNFTKYIYYKYFKRYNVKMVRSWGLNNELDGLFMINPSLVLEKVKAPVSKLEIDFNTDYIKRVSNVFNFNVNEKIPKTDKIFLYLALGFMRKVNQYKETEIEVLKKMIQIAKKFNYQIVIKVKGNEDFSFYSNLDSDCTFITDAIPAELISYSLDNSVICSFASSSNLYQKNTNKYAWIYPIVGYKGVHKNPKKFNISLIERIEDFENLFK